MGCCNAVSPQGSKLGSDDSSKSPQKDRSPKDIFFLILFVLMLGAMAYLCYYSTGVGDPYRYVNGSDSWGNVCGRNNSPIGGVRLSGKDHSQRGFAFHMGLSNIKTAMNPLSYLRSNQKPAVICVRECPNDLIDCTELLTQNDYDNIPQTLLDEHICTMPFDLILPHISLLNRCIPKQVVQVFSGSGNLVTEDDNNSTNNLNDTASVFESMAATVSKHILTSIQKYWRDTIYLTLISFVLCFMVMLSLQCFTRIVVVACITIGGLGSLMLTVFLWFNYAIAQGYVTEEKLSNVYEKISPAKDEVVNFVSRKIENRVNLASQIINVTTPSSNGIANMTINTVDLGHIFDILAFDSIKMSDYLLPWSIISTIVTAVIFLVLIAVRKSICLVIKIFDEASLAILNMPAVLFEPIKALFAYTYVCVYFFVVAAYIITIQGPVVDGRGFVSFQEKNGTSITSLFLAHLFGCLWMMQFVSGCQQIIIAGAISRWYFTRGEDRLKKKKKTFAIASFTLECSISPAFRATGDLILYHLGTVAFGSLVIGVIQTLRFGIAYIQKYLRGNQSEYAEKIAKALRCCLACFEKFMKFINRNAYICASMYGFSFFQSGKKALTLLINNAQHALAMNCISNFCNFLGKMAVVALTIFISIAYFKYYRADDEALLSEYFVPLFTVAIGAHLIAQGFFTVYDTALDTIFLCFCDDQERNNGDDRPYYSSVKLQQYMNSAVNPNRSTKDARKSSSETNNAPSISARSVSPSVSDFHQLYSLKKKPRFSPKSYRNLPEPSSLSSSRFENGVANTLQQKQKSENETTDQLVASRRVPTPYPLKNYDNALSQIPEPYQVSLPGKLADKEYRQLSASSARFPTDASKDNSGSNKNSMNNSPTSKWSLPINTVFHSSV